MCAATFTPSSTTLQLLCGVMEQQRSSSHQQKCRCDSRSPASCYMHRPITSSLLRTRSRSLCARVANFTTRLAVANGRVALVAMSRASATHFMACDHGRSCSVERSHICAGSSSPHDSPSSSSRSISSWRSSSLLSSLIWRFVASRCIAPAKGRNMNTVATRNSER